MNSSRRFEVICLLFLVLFASSCVTTGGLSKDLQPEPSPEKILSLQGISFVEEENHTRIRLEGSEAMAPPLDELLSDPLRIVIDIPHIDLKQIKDPVEIDNGIVGKVLTTQYDDKGRIEIGLNRAVKYTISREDKSLVVDIERMKEGTEANEGEKKEETVEGKGGEPPVAESTPTESPAVESSPESNKEETLPAQPIVDASASESAKAKEPIVTASGPETAKAKEIINFLLEQKKDLVTLNILADGKVGNFDSFKLDSPPRLVLDILEMSTRYPQRLLKVQNPLIKEVRIGQHPDKLRIVFYPVRHQVPSYEISRIDDKLIVRLGNIPQPAGPQILLQGQAVEAVRPLETKEVSASPLERAAQPNPSLISKKETRTPKTNSMTEIDFKQMDNGSRVLVNFTEEPSFEAHLISKKEIAVDIRNALAPKRLQRGLDTSEFESSVNFISIENVRTGKLSDVRILIKLKEEVPFETAREGKTLFIDIERPKKVEAQKEASPPVEMKTPDIKREEERVLPEQKEADKILPPREEKSVPQVEVVKKAEGEKKPIEGGVPERSYTGRKLSLDFKDADIKNILRLIAEVSNLNIIAGDDVGGRVTMRLVDVPWDQALDVILQARSLGMTRVGNVVRVAPLDVLKKEVQAELEAKRTKERLEDLAIDLLRVNYATAKDLVLQVKSMLSDRGDVKVDERTNTLIIKDIPKKIADVKGVIRTLDTRTPQVLIEARIVEANLTFQRELGVQWGFLASTGTDKGKTLTAGGGVPGASSISPGTATNSIVNLPAIAQAGVGGSGQAGILELLFTSKYGLKQLDVTISAHENKGDVKIISSPKIAALDHKEASIEQGLRIPYRKLTTEGTITTDFIDANLKLTVTPHVTADGYIKMVIKAKKDAPDYSVTVEGVPRIDKKEAITEVLVRDNAIVVIAGVYSIEKDDLAEGVPLFNKIPLLGWLFKRESKQDLRKDLLIFISPKILKDEI